MLLPRRCPLSCLGALIAASCVAACAVGPDYRRPEIALPAAYKEAPGWTAAQPRDAEARGPWWEAFGDARLNALAEQVEVSNQTLATAVARYAQTQAATRAARARLFPSLGAGASATRSRNSGTGATSATATTTSDVLSLDAQWEADLWGRIRRTVESNDASAQASAADLAATRLSLQAQLAQSYFQLRVADAERVLLERAVVAYGKSVELTGNRYRAGIATRADVAQARALLATTRAQLIDTGIARAQLEHAIAVLIGKAPADFSLPADVPEPASADAPVVAPEALLLGGIAPPAIPPALPAQLLERRPDVAAAERRVAAANAQIGVARAAYFPTLMLNASGGYRGTEWTDLISLPHRFWSIGPALALTLFDGGARRALGDQAVAAYDAQAASYRQSVLDALQEVEDNLVALRVLAEEAQAQAESVQAAHESLRLITNQYKAGTATFLNVLSAQTSALGAERAALGVRGRQYVASAALVKALGGGWAPSFSGGPDSGELAE